MSGVYAQVELNVLLCPGCRETVSDQPPSTLRTGKSVLNWSHSDGSPLCGQTDPKSVAGAVEPVEWPVGWAR
jgi:hypothetical protein